MKKETKEIVLSQNEKLENTKETSRFIELAIKNGLSVETMEKLFSLHEKVKAEQAKTNYLNALANFQGECPIIGKDKIVFNKDGRTVRYQYAPLDSIISQVKDILSKNRLSYRWEVENKAGVIRTTAIITHEDGHSEESSFEVPIDEEGYMTAPQKYASALTFAKRYAFCNALGISTGDEDTDATDVGKELAPKSLKSQIVFSLRRLGIEPKEKEEFEKIIKTKVGLELKESNYQEIVDRLEVLIFEKDENTNL